MEPKESSARRYSQACKRKADSAGCAGRHCACSGLQVYRATPLVLVRTQQSQHVSGKERLDCAYEVRTNYTAFGIGDEKIRLTSRQISNKWGPAQGNHELLDVSGSNMHASRQVVKGYIMF